MRKISESNSKSKAANGELNWKRFNNLSGVYSLKANGACMVT